jgi:hypothetical protein
MSYKKGLTAALKKFLAASDDLKKFALNNKMSKTHVDYAQEVVAARARDLKRELSYEHNEINLELPDDGDDEMEGLEKNKTALPPAASQEKKPDDKPANPASVTTEQNLNQNRSGVVGRDSR